jgi:hypothetical protein
MTHFCWWQLNGLLFFAVAMTAATSMVIFYIFVLYGTVVGGGCAIFSLAQRQALQNEQRAPPQRINRPHQE